jgi:CelD/BcsL family acetyltransferase involved in cellulose biosynthesis
MIKAISLRYIIKKICVLFFYYLKDDIHSQILFIAAGVNMKYSRYSPGILSLNAFINNQIDTGEIELFDFTRGNESYKYAVGGKKHEIETISFTVNN